MPPATCFRKTTCESVVAKSRATVYWDTCLFFALIKDEKRADPNEMPGLYAVASEIDNGLINMVTSAVTLGELDTLKPEWLERLRKFLNRSNVDVVPLAPHMGERSGQLRAHYRALGKPYLCREDSYHLATSIALNVAAFHTFDERDKKGCRGLLGLNGNVAGFPLRIMKPVGSQGQAVLTL